MFPSSRNWFRLQVELITGLAGWVPKKPGILLRSLLYPLILARLGKKARIEWGSEFRGTQQIEIGDHVFVGRNVCLDASTVGGQIQIGNHVYLLDNVRLMSFNNYGKVILHDHVGLDRGVDLKALEHGCIEVGRSTYIGPYVCMAGPGQIKIGANCLIASHSSIYANQHVFSDLTVPIVEQGTTQKGVVIEDDCWLGTGVKVLDGVTIGQGSVIGAGAVVTKDIPPFSVAVGVPATVISQRSKKRTHHNAVTLNGR